MNLVGNSNLYALILAAGKGTRMQSDLPKVLHKLGEKTLLQHVTDKLRLAGIQHSCVLLGGDLESFADYLSSNPDVDACQQLAREGTADAVAATADYFAVKSRPSYARGKVLRGSGAAATAMLICLGDTPAINPQTIAAFVNASEAQGAKIGVLGMINPAPTGYGRLVCDASNNLLRIVEEKLATAEEKLVTLCNTGVVYAQKEYLFNLLTQVERNPVSGEYFLTDCFAAARARGDAIYVHQTENYREFDGVNDQKQLRDLSSWMRDQGGI